MSKLEKLKELQSMLDNDLITEEEFKSLKNEIMNSSSESPKKVVKQPEEREIVSKNDVSINAETQRRFGHYGEIIEETEQNVWVKANRTGKTLKFDKTNPKHGKLNRSQSPIAWFGGVTATSGAAIFGWQWRVSMRSGYHAVNETYLYLAVGLLLAGVVLSIIAMRQSKLKYDNYWSIYNLLVASLVLVLIGVFTFYNSDKSASSSDNSNYESVDYKNNKAQLEKDVLNSIRNDYGEEGISITSVYLVHSEGNYYNGYVDVNEYGDKFRYNLYVTVNGNEFLYEIE